jgi:FkbM family methyltransferase
VSVSGAAVDFIARIAAGSPLRSRAERWMRSLGHRYPASWAVQSVCRHFGGHLIRTEGERFARIAKFGSGGEMRCSNIDGLGAVALSYYFHGTITGQTEDERPIVALFRRFVRPGDIFLDIGANLGFYSFFVGAICGRDGEVHAFEANPRLRMHLMRSIELNRHQANIQLNSVAVGRTNTMMQLYGVERIGCSSLYQHEWLNRNTSVTVPVTTIDEYRRNRKLRRIDAVKIDIEGAELDAFHGMANTFEECPPWIIVCELMPALNTHGATPQDNLRRASSAEPMAVIEFLGARGYSPYYIEETGRLGETVPDKIVQQLEGTVLNVCFVRSGLRERRPDLFSVC